ncbi:GNAT family N-acetyltransferase [Xenophilus sp. Marseille-Q4582]|uniref:GNAT family N-acetyltransferase n=1 Tax=Xenophilus sp. Marseille-Q4582 TaxID=2866600 RepID=UPI001CE40005|nr:GNAT family N-acetyltransferase [Xenophilus sp. Marseille-Q4582]
MNAAPAPRLRAMDACDLPQVLAIQLACYGADFVEAGPLILRRLACAPATAWVAEHEGQVHAYLTGYPSRRGKLTALHGDFEPAAADADTLYLHDLAVHPSAHGLRLGPSLVAHALAHGRRQGWRYAALVAVQDSRGFWARHGFVRAALADAAQQARLASYPGTAVYMVRDARATA